MSDTELPGTSPAIDASTAAPSSADLSRLIELSARDAQMYLETITEVASGSAPESAISLSLLSLAQILMMGARLGAIQDVVPDERFEPDDGPDADAAPLRGALANVFEGLDDYADLVDPVTSTEVTTGSLSNDLSLVATALDHGLRHFQSGRHMEALWWWQFSYLSDWGERAAMALRVLHGMLAHLRLDTDEDTVAEAEFEALHP